MTPPGSPWHPTALDDEVKLQRHAIRSRRVRAAHAAALFAAFFVMLAAAAPAVALENDIELENDVSDALPSRASANAPEPDQEGGKGGLPFAVLPQAGYGPETGAQAGIKFEGRNLFGGSTFL